MKKIYNHTKREYEKENLEWDDAEYIEEYDEEFCDDSEFCDDTEYYEEEEICDDEEFYEDEAAYEAEEFDGEEEYYEESEEVYEDEVYEDEYFEDEDFEEEDEVVPWTAMSDKNIFRKIWYGFLNMSTMDRIMSTTGVLILILCLVTGAVYIGTRATNKQVSAFSAVGSQLEGITVIGEGGLTAVADAELARIWAENGMGDDDDGYNESEYTKEVEVTLNMISIEKDLKVKFVNARSNKLIANVPFVVSVKTPDGSTETWTDDDMDGIIYKTEITPGNYTVSLNKLEDSKYEDYIISTAARKATVKKEISYEKVDVSDEIKDESEVNAKEEDTKENETTVESALQDTVTWVESKKTVLDAVYTAVAKTSVADPLATAKNTKYMRAGSVTMNNLELTVGGTGSVAVTAPDGVTFSNITYTSSDATKATVDASGNVTALAAGSTTITFTATGTTEGSGSVSGDVSGGESVTETYTGSCTVTVKEATPAPIPVTGVTLDQTTLTLEAGKTAALKATVAPADAAVQTVTWSTSDAAVATVDNNGTVTAVKEGTATITVTTTEGGFTATCAVTVKAAVAEGKKELTLDVTSLNVPMGGTATIKATVKNSVSGGDVTGKITAVSEKPEVAEVAVGTTTNGVTTITVTPKAAGETKVTVTLDGSITATCTVKVDDRTVLLDRKTISVLTGVPKEMLGFINSEGGEVKVETSNKDIVTATVTTTKANGQTTAKIVLTGVKAGSATITLIHTENKVEVKNTCTVNVVAKENKLLDKDKNQLYVLVANNQYREATYEDYYNPSITTFYQKTEGIVKYTGWQTLDGKLYFFDASGKKVTGEQVIQGAKYNFASDGSLVVGNGTFGIDVSKWNGTIDWKSVKNSGVNYVIIRCGYRGSSAGSLIEDPKFRENIKGATAAGIKVGVYFFSQAINKNEAVEEASMVLELISKYTISYPVFLDVEASGGRADGIDKATRTAVIKAFCETIQNSGYTAGVYANKSWLTNKIDTSQLSKYKIWLAQYASAPTYTGRYDLWQYKSTGKVTGISGNVDLNISYLGY